MNINDVFESKYLKADDLQGRTALVTIDRVTPETMKNREGKDERKLVISFKGKQKPMILNKTNAFNISFAYGEETDDWVGQQVELYVEATMLNGQPTKGLRIRPHTTRAEYAEPAPQPQRQTAATSAPRPQKRIDLDDSVPF